MANAKILRWGPNATYIPPTRVGDSRGVTQILGFSVFRYHVCIPNTKLWPWGSEPTQGPNVNGFALQWNIGFTGLNLR